MDMKAKMRPLYIAKLLYENTDEEHYLTIVQMMRILEREYGIKTSRGTVAQDIKVLQAVGIEIVMESSTQNRYSYIGRRFDLPELKMLIDAVESARFVPKEKSAVLVQKLSSLTSSHNTSALVRNVDVENRIKADNEKIFYIMDALNDAISMGRKVSFSYFSYNQAKQKVERQNGIPYCFSPYKLIWNGDYYYVVGFSDKHDRICSFRIDRIARQPLILEEEAVAPPADFSLNHFLNSMFRMYDGRRDRVELICSNDVMDAVIDRFGEDVTVLSNDADSFRILVEIAVGNVFYSWIFGFGGKVKIAAPQAVIEEYSAMLASAYQSL